MRGVGSQTKPPELSRERGALLITSPRGLKHLVVHGDGAHARALSAHLILTFPAWLTALAAATKKKCVEYFAPEQMCYEPRC